MSYIYAWTDAYEPEHRHDGGCTWAGCGPWPEDEHRDLAEEAYWRAYCQACGASPCTWDGTPDGFHTDDGPVDNAGQPYDPPGWARARMWQERHRDDPEPPDTLQEMREPE